MCGERKMSVGEAGGNGLRKRAEPMTLLLLDATLLPRAKGTGSHWLSPSAPGTLGQERVGESRENLRYPRDFRVLSNLSTGTCSHQKILPRPTEELAGICGERRDSLFWLIRRLRALGKHKKTKGPLESQLAAPGMSV